MVCLLLYPSRKRNFPWHLGGGLVLFLAYSTGLTINEIYCSICGLMLWTILREENNAMICISWVILVSTWCFDLNHMLSYLSRNYDQASHFAFLFFVWWYNGWCSFCIRFFIWESFCVCFFFSFVKSILGKEHLKVELILGMVSIFGHIRSFIKKPYFGLLVFV